MFREAVSRLTLQYSLLIVAILAVFSAGLYWWVDNLFDTQYIQQVEQRLGTNDDLAVTAQQHKTVAAASDVAVEQFRNILLAADVAALLIIPFASYLIARRSLVPLIEANASQKRFVSNASHELRTPLAVMSGEFELALKKERDVEYYKNTIVSSKEELDRLNRLTSQLMQLQRIENNQNKSSLEMHVFSTDKFIEDIYNRYEKIIAKSGFVLNKNIEDDVDWMMANEELLSVAMDNLLSNAMKYSKQKSIITIGAVGQDSGVMLYIENVPSIKIDKKNASQFFERFWQSKNELEKGGFGLGLAIVKAIIDVHKGSVELKQSDHRLRVCIVVKS